MLIRRALAQGVSDPLQFVRPVFRSMDDRAKWAPQGPRRPKSVRFGRAGSRPIGLKVMATAYSRRIRTTPSRSTLKMK